jgi:hypothetical protein
VLDIVNMMRSCRYRCEKVEDEVLADVIVKGR